MSEVVERNDATKMKYCKYCGSKIPEDAVLCTKCGRQVEELKSNQNPAQVVINNTNTNANVNKNTNGVGGYRAKNKWVALLLCVFLGYIGAHKFYEEKAGMGILYLCTMGLFGIGVILDFIALLFKPNPYYV